MSPSGAEYIKRIRAQIEEVDPSEVKPLVGNGVPIIDVREAEEFAVAHLPGAKSVPRGYLESRIDAAVPDRKQRVILYCASGQRSALAAHTLKTELGFEDVASMTGGITLWKDRGYEVEAPRALTAEQRLERVGGERGALSRGAVEDDLAVLVADLPLDARLEVAARHVDRARDVTGVPLLALADVDEDDAVAEVRLDLGRVDLLDLALDLADDLRAGRAHGISPRKKSIGIPILQQV